MPRVVMNGLKLAAVVLIAFYGLVAGDVRAANVQFVGSVSYTYVGSTAVLTANRVENFTNGGTSGTLRMELWAFPAPFTGSVQVGYRLATHSLGQLAGNFYYFNISSGTIAFGYPPNGSWAVVMMLTEFDNGPSNGGYSVRDYVNFSQPLVVGPPPAPGQLSVITSLSFPTQPAGTASAPQTIVVTNIGGTTVTVSSINLTNTVDFVGYTACSVLAPGASCTGTVTFTPHAAGYWTGTVVITSNGLYSPQYIQLSGSAVAVAAPGQLSMASALSFGNQTIGTTSAAQTVTISNVGGQGVTTSSMTISGADFNGSTSGCGFIAAGSFCTAAVTFSPTVAGNRSGTVNIVSNGVGSPQFIQLSGVGVTTAPPTPTTALAIEYYHAAFDHYFVTAIAVEITKLDNGTFVGWTRTGRSFNVYTSTQAGLASVCRFFSTTFAPKSSHFYTPDAPECSIVQANPNWLFEAVVFYMAKADINGNCPALTQPVYRLYNNGQGAAPNHRYTTSATVRTQMIGQGWIPEGYGPVGVIMCAPL